MEYYSHRGLSKDSVCSPTSHALMIKVSSMSSAPPPWNHILHHCSLQNIVMLNMIKVTQFLGQDDVYTPSTPEPEEEEAKKKIMFMSQFSPMLRFHDISVFFTFFLKKHSIAPEFKSPNFLFLVMVKWSVISHPCCIRKGVF